MLLMGAEGPGRHTHDEHMKGDLIVGVTVWVSVLFLLLLGN